MLKLGKVAKLISIVVKAAFFGGTLIFIYEYLGETITYQ